MRLDIKLVFAVILALAMAGSAYSLCCGGAAYTYGVCQNNQFYEGCQFTQQDGSVIVYEPGTIIEPCLRCECVSVDACDGLTYTPNIHCQWQPQHSLCDVCHRCTMEWQDSVNRECSRDQFGFDDPTNPFGLEYYHPLSLPDPADVAPNGSNCDAYVGSAYPAYFPEYNQTESCGPHNSTPSGTEATYVCGWDSSTNPYCSYGNPDENYPSIPYVRVSANIGPGGVSTPLYACHEACFTANEDGDSKDYVYSYSSCSLINGTWCNGTIGGVAQFLDRDYNSTLCTDNTGCTDYSWVREGMWDADPVYKFGGYGDGFNWDGAVNYPPVGCFPYIESCLECCGDDTNEADINQLYCTGQDGRTQACCQSPADEADTCAWTYGAGDVYCTPKAGGENQNFPTRGGSILAGCSDGIDNDCDGFIDGADYLDCFGCSAGSSAKELECAACALGAGNCDTYKCCSLDKCLGGRDTCMGSCPVGYQASAADITPCDRLSCDDQLGVCCTPNPDMCLGASDMCSAGACPNGYVAGDDGTPCDVNPGDQAGVCCKEPPGLWDFCSDAGDGGRCMASCTETCPINYTSSSIDTGKCDLVAVGDQVGVCCRQVPQCADGCDNDANGCRDFPTDKGCVSGTDDTESGGTCTCNQDGACDVGESCDCSDCAGFQDSCQDTLVCDQFTTTCKCELGNYMLYSGTCGNATVPYQYCDYDDIPGGGENATDCEDNAPGYPTPPRDPACNFNGTCELWNETTSDTPEVCSCSDCKFSADCMPKTCTNDGICSAQETCECADCNRKARCTAQCDNDNVCDSRESCTCSDCNNKPAQSCISGTLCMGLNCTCLPQLEVCSDGTCRTNCDKNPYVYEVFCFDGIDNDGDGYVDFQDPENFPPPEYDSLAPDPDCIGKINGTITNSSGGIIEGATVHIIGGLSYWGKRYTYSYNVTSNDTGHYAKGVNGGTTYDITVTFKDHSPGVNYSVYMPFFGYKEINYTLRREVSTCNSQCTRGTSNVCDASCHGWNGCLFPSPEIMDICDEPGPDAHTTEHTVEYNSTHEVACCTGGQTRMPTPKIAVRKATFNVSSDNVVVNKRIVILNGKPVTMYVAVFD